MVAQHENRRAAIRAALAEAERHLLEDEAICLRLHQASGIVSVLRADGRSRKLLARFAWDPTKESS